MTIHLLIYFRVDSKRKQRNFLFVIQTSLNIILRAAINKGTNNPFKSQTYKIAVFALMLLGTVLRFLFKMTKTQKNCSLQQKHISS